MIVTKTEVKAILNIPVADTSKDTQIDLFIPFVQQDIIDKTNNNFLNKNVSVSSTGFSFVKTTNDINLADTSIDLTDSFQIGMDIFINGSIYNDFHFEILKVAAQKLELNDLITVINEDAGSGITITYAVFPKPLKMTASFMIQYRIKNTSMDIKSEKIGKYQITYRDNNVPADYPEMILAGLNKNGYKLGKYT